MQNEVGIATYYILPPQRLPVEFKEMIASIQEYTGKSKVTLIKEYILETYKKIPKNKK